MKFPKVDSAILQWIDKNNLKTSRGEPFEWTKHAFLIQPMSDWSKHIAIRKSAQIGFSESFGFLKSIYAALFYKWNIIYTLPTDTAAENFVTTKFDPMLTYNPELETVVKGGKSIKEIKSRFIYFRGTHNAKTQDVEAEGDKAISITSDWNIHDERDRSNQLTIEQYESRLENSDYGGICSFSNPTYPGVGTDGLYELSDQKVWMVICEHCNHRQWLDWVKVGEVTGTVDFGLVDPDKKIFVCGKCRGEISDTTRLRGEWVPRFPGREISGYWMSQLNYVKHTAESLLSKEARQSKQNFYNFALGKPYRGTDTSVDRSMIIKNIDMVENEKKQVAIGVDNGVIKHYVIGNEDGIFQIGKTKSWDVIESLLNKHDAYMVIDGNPYPRTPKELAQKYKGRVFVAFYKKDRNVMEAVDFKKKADKGVVYIQRTAFIDQLVDKFSRKEKPVNIQERDLEEYIKHWETLSRIDVKDSLGVISGQWLSSTGVDHFAHATIYQDVAMQKTRQPESATDNPSKVRIGKPAVEVNLDYTIMPDLGKDYSHDDDWKYS